MSAVITLKSRFDYDRVYQNGRSYANRLLIMYVMPNGTASDRYGLVVSKKVGNSVIRHRARRLMKESVRLTGRIGEKGYDVVLIARPGIRDKKLADVDEAFHHLLTIMRHKKPGR
ncbi:MAG: ribonuclease P protein component [Lachnospiraceae bacterium]|jgi:ribonuclease P protein component|nr:ribonuclease P protein component [Lachnospiraceae bacterium]